jgi:hypothetical protein
MMRGAAGSGKVVVIPEMSGGSYVLINRLLFGLLSTIFIHMPISSASEVLQESNDSHIIRMTDGQMNVSGVRKYEAGIMSVL